MRCKKFFLLFFNFYYGEILGVLSVGDVKFYKDIYIFLLFKNFIIFVFKNDYEIENSLNVLKCLLDKYSEEICVFIVELFL